MKSLGALGKAGIVLLVLNELRGIVVALSVVAAWSHAGAARPPAHGVSAPAHLAPAALRLERLTGNSGAP